MRKTANVTREDLISVPVPQRTATYTPVPNSRVLNAVETISGDYGLQVHQTNYKLTANGNAMVATYAMKSSEDIGAMVAIMNSYDKTRRLSVATGGNVFVCMNGMILGEHLFKNKHVGVIDDNLLDLVDGVVSKAYQQLEVLNQHADIMRGTKVSSMDIAHTLGELFYEEEVLNTFQMNLVKKQLSESENFAIKSAEDSHLWNFYNNITEALKTAHPHDYIKKHVELHQFIENKYSIVIDEPIDIASEIVV